jgi:hypothetical protein
MRKLESGEEAVICRNPHREFTSVDFGSKIPKSIWTVAPKTWQLPLNPKHGENLIVLSGEPDLLGLDQFHTSIIEKDDAASNLAFPARLTAAGLIHP